MDIFDALTAAVIYLALNAFDIAILFIVVRLLVSRSSMRWLVALNTVGVPVVDLLLDAFDRCAQYRFQGIRGHNKLMIILALLLIARFILAALLHAL